MKLMTIGRKLNEVKGRVMGVVYKHPKLTATVMGATSIMAAEGHSFAAAPSTGDTDVDAALTAMGGGFTTAKSGFAWLALAAVPVTILVVVFFWIRGKFKHAVSGA
ncbi:hypothetical protein [Paenibacillus sp. SI8]|uniref:hypothetical protein n=1 Tax=unclassified Paenibacillus TaxID=185978 RepID=UPI0034662DF1